MPPEQTPVESWQLDVGLSQTTPAHGSLLQRPVPELHPEVQLVSVCWKVHAPVPGVQVPLEKLRDTDALAHVGAGGVHTFAEPPHVPAPSQTSESVHATPSSHGDPLGFSA